MSVLHGGRRDDLARSLLKFGTRLGCEDWGEVWVQDGQVWLLDAHHAEPLGDLFLYLEQLHRGLRTLYPLKRTPPRKETP